MCDALWCTACLFCHPAERNTEIPFWLAYAKTPGQGKSVQRKGLWTKHSVIHRIVKASVPFYSMSCMWKILSNHWDRDAKSLDVSVKALMLPFGVWVHYCWQDYVAWVEIWLPAGHKHTLSYQLLTENTPHWPRVPVQWKGQTKSNSNNMYCAGYNLFVSYKYKRENLNIYKKEFFCWLYTLLLLLLLYKLLPCVAKLTASNVVRTLLKFSPVYNHSGSKPWKRHRLKLN